MIRQQCTFFPIDTKIWPNTWKRYGVMLSDFLSECNIGLSGRCYLHHYSITMQMTLLKECTESKNFLAVRVHFWIVTGQATHFLLAAPEEIICPFHEFGQARERQCQARETPLINPSIATPRAFFTNGKPHHCCHEDVAGSKYVLITDQNIERCGPRSGRNNDAFCEIAPVDEYLCCRLCAFQHVCSSSDILRLPCTAT